jgi:hypothetical protein
VKKNGLNIIGSLVVLYFVKRLFDDMQEQTKANQIHNAAMLSAFSSIIRVNNQAVNFVPTLQNLPL